MLTNWKPQTAKQLLRSLSDFRNNLLSHRMRTPLPPLIMSRETYDYLKTTLGE